MSCPIVSALRTILAHTHTQKNYNRIVIIRKWLWWQTPWLGQTIGKARELTFWLSTEGAKRKTGIKWEKLLITMLRRRGRYVYMFIFLIWDWRAGGSNVWIKYEEDLERRKYRSTGLYVFCFFSSSSYLPAFLCPSFLLFLLDSFQQ